MAGNNNQNGWPNLFGIGIGSPLSVVLEQQASSSNVNQLDHLDRVAAGSNTLKRNPKMELTKNDLLKLVTYFEGEIQARDITIAVLKSEKIKQVANMGRYKPVAMSDPYIALLRDCIIDSPSSKRAVSERDIAQVADLQLQALEQLALQQKKAHQHMTNILNEAELKHKKVIQELEEEKCKHEHDTAQGDDITYGLEMERTRLKQELEAEKTARKKLEKEVKKQQELADEERARQKQIVLLLLAERKKIIIKYIEERKRSEDLAQILSEEKSRIDSMAEGLEEESKKSLQMEAELEKQMHLFEDERKNLKSSLALKEARCLELEAEIQRLRAECDSLRLTAGNRRTDFSESTPSAPSMTSSVAKAVQPTATVSSVPVSGPMTGIAQSVTPQSALRHTSPASGLKQACVSTAQSPSVTAGAVTGNIQRMNSVASKAAAIQHQVAAATPSSGPQLPAKKAVAPPPGGLGRGTPPPIPPNKPVIQIKQNPTVARCRPSVVTNSSPGVSSPGAGDKVKEQPQVGQAVSTTGVSAERPPGIEMLGQELADFQQMFVTLATTSNNT